MRLNRKGIPARVLNGKVPKYISVHKAYTAHMARQIMVKLNASFWARAKRGADDLGNTWKPLQPKTHAYKPLSPIEKRTFKLNGKLERGLLTPAQNKQWSKIFARTYHRLKKKGTSDAEAKEIAGKRAWAVLKAAGARTKIGLNRITDTNIRTGRLVAATRPGKVANNRYYSPKDQIVSINPRSIKIRFNIPYAKKVDKQRPIVPNNIEPWIQQAHEVAIIEAKQIYDRIKDATPDRTRRNKRKPTRRNRRK